MTVTEGKTQPDNVQPIASGSEHVAARDFVTEPENRPLDTASFQEEGSRLRHSEEGSPTHGLAEPDSIRVDQSIPEAAPQDPSVPDIPPSAAVAALETPAISAPSAIPVRKWLLLDGKQGTWQYEPGNSRPRFVEKKFTSRIKDSNEETLLKAARFGHEDILATLLLEQEAGTEFVEPQRRRTPFLLAAEGGYAVIVQLLLDNGARWKVTDSWKRTALHLASLNGRDEVVQLLLHRTAIGVDDKDEQGSTALHLAARSGDEVAIKCLLDHGAVVQMKDKKGNTPLHLAAKKSLAAVETLLRIAATPVDDKSSNNRTPLMQACDRPPSEDSEDIVKLLIHNGAKVSVRDNNEETPLFLAASNGNYRVVELLIQHHAEVNTLNVAGNSALFGPARLGYEETARVLLEGGIDSRVINNDSPTGRTALLESVKYDKANVALLILEKWAENGFEHQNLLQSALFEAALYDSSKVARLLVERGANISEKETVSSKTPVEIANSHSSTKVVALLLEKGGQLFSQGPSLDAHIPQAPSEIDATPLMPVDSKIDLGFGFKSTIVSFSFDRYENSAIVRPPVQSVLYDHNPEAIKTGLQAAAGLDPNGKNFRWLHIPGNNPVWVNNLITRIYKDCRPVEKAAYFQKKCKHLFGEEIWSRHQYQMSSASVAHRRFIRPVCQQIPIDKTDKDNMMMVLPYFHWETTKARDKMTNVIIEAMKSCIGDASPSSTAKLKGLSQALKELERARNPDYDEGETSDSATDYDSSSYYTVTESSTATSSDRRTRRSRNSRFKNEKTNMKDEPEWIADWAGQRDPDTRNVGRSKSAAVTRPEEERRRKRRIEKIAELAQTSRSADDKLVLSYMFHETAPMHFRRTLDQYYYYTLPTTEARDKDQVVTRYFERTWPGDDKLVLMVDQLWLWILDNDTIVTSFPQRWDKAKKQGDRDPDPSNASDIVETVLRHVARTDRRPLESTLDLAELIASKCIGTMFEHPDFANDKLRFSEFFEVSIGNVTNEESKMFDEFTELSKRLATGDHFAADLDMLFNISKETDLIKEIKDIRDELHIISTVLVDQEKVLVEMDAIIRAIKEGKVHEPAESEEDAKDARQASRTQHGLVGNVRRHIETVKALDKQAEKTYLSLNDLLDLKQKQANVSEARSQRQQAQETARQGQTLMLFTVITVFFLPLSFLTTFFQLDIADYVRNGEGQLGLGYISEITFPITAAVVAVSLVLAFRINVATISVKCLKATWRGLKYAAGALLVIALMPFIFGIVFSTSRAESTRRPRETIIEEERYSR
ncbi:hypothetical protein ONS95_006785 [Cadophora gregata]|uniref:uncharacterized protein n=1 Tax=Cadophora gregata TaxID=51156 RepID=UPI0026DB9A26|nr:uncharacterized protein ONS95_006785 [Cadophora gregata]KAK0101622.1 hypothetical protein ONS95_006785 [Cadophora gregata]KAK0106361.1 hypothetical protein ONS96_003996 [Cadophora gregata f. sp. sojae]